MSPASILHMSPSLVIVYLFCAPLILQISSASPVSHPLLPANLTSSLGLLQNAQNIPANLTSSLGLLQTAHNLSEQRTTCDGGTYKWNLIKDECLDALATIPTDTDMLSFGDRDHGEFDIPLPYRWISRESIHGILRQGKDAMDLRLTRLQNMGFAYLI